MEFLIGLSDQHIRGLKRAIVDAKKGREHADKTSTVEVFFPGTSTVVMGME